MKKLPFDLPPINPGGQRPVWTGREFLIGFERVPVIAYEAGPSGWSDELTALHEDETASGTHFIDVASRQRAISNLARHGFRRDGFIMEVGVSGGHFLRDLRARFPQATLIGSDYTLETLRALAGRMTDIPFIRMDLTRSPLPDSIVDAVVLLNVLEHIDNDLEAMRQCHRMLRLGGLFVIEVPAGPDLFDDYDRELMHFRRYSSDELAQKVTSAGFTVLEQSYIGSIIYPAFWASKKWARRKPRAEAISPRGSHVRKAIRATAKVSKVGRWLMRVEAALASKTKLPFGIRCVLVARKAES